MHDFKPALPAGWPTSVKPPGLPGWEQSAYKWLADQAPGAWRDGLTGRQYREHPLMLARDLQYLVDAWIQALRDAYSRARIELPAVANPGLPRPDGGMPHPDLAPNYTPEQIDEKLAQYAEEGPRLKELARQVTVVYDALSGVRWVPRSRNDDWTRL